MLLLQKKNTNTVAHTLQLNSPVFLLPGCKVNLDDRASDFPLFSWHRGAHSGLQTKGLQRKEQHRKGKGSPRVFCTLEHCAQVLLVFVHAFNIYVWFDGNVCIISSWRVKASLLWSGLVLQKHGHEYPSDTFLFFWEVFYRCIVIFLLNTTVNWEPLWL